jgi:transcription elongation factor GreA
VQIRKRSASGGATRLPVREEFTRDDAPGREPAEQEIPVTIGVFGNKPRGPVVGAVVTVPSPLELLTQRLELLRAERTGAMADSLRDESGDAADRATNVEASIRVQLLDERIALLELEIDELKRSRPTDGVVSVGGTVRLDLGDGPEEYVVGSVEQAAAGVPIVTPGSPLGRAILGAEVGSTVTYEPRRGIRLEVRILGAESNLVHSA